jgi:magnesium chelatase subunit I
VERVSRKVIIEQNRFEESAKSNGIDVTFISVEKKIDSEFLASMIELVLEGLRFIDPPLIERRNGLYVSSKI